MKKLKQITVEMGAKMFYIRADANKEIATGHIMRCLTIASELKKRNIDTTFITADHMADEIIHARGYKTICLDSCWSDLDTEIEKMKVLIDRESINTLLLDTYFVTDKYLEELNKRTKIIYIDDLGEIRYPVNMIINYNIYGTEMNYCKGTGCQPHNLILGPKYAPLREEFQQIIPLFQEKVSKIFISTGGADKYNIAKKLLERFSDVEKYANLEFHVISGKMNVNFSSLADISKKASHIYIHSDVKNISEIMCQCDIAISAGGSTLYELCCCGLPILTFSFADNQKQGVAVFDKAKVAVNCGDARDGLDNLVDVIEEALIRLIQKNELRKNMHENAIALVDGQGVKRLVDEILRIL